MHEVVLGASSHEQGVKKDPAAGLTGAGDGVRGRKGAETMSEPLRVRTSGHRLRPD